MAAFKGKKPATREARKILLGQIRKALEPLTARRASDTHVHRARKQIKKARATLRLLRKSLPASRYRAENQCLRNASQPLSHARDACVLLQTLDDLKTGSGSRGGELALRRQLVGERSRARATIAGAYGLPRVRRLLHNAEAEACRWRVKRKGWSVIGPGLKKVYSRGREAFAVVRRSPGAGQFHEWRKQSNYLRHQLQLLEPLWPGPLECLVKEVHALGDYLGDDHDLALLRSKAEFNQGLRSDERAREAVLTSIDGRRRALQRKALRLGARLYSDPPLQFCRRLERYWHSWRHSVGEDNERATQ